MATYYREGPGFCTNCNKPVVARQEFEKPNHLLHFIISFFTCCFWIPVWIFLAFFRLSPTGPRFCSLCGNTIGHNPTLARAEGLFHRQESKEKALSRRLSELEAEKIALLERIPTLDRERERLVAEWNRLIALLDQAKADGDKAAIKDLTQREQAHWNRVEKIDSEKESIEQRLSAIDKETAKLSPTPQSRE